MTLAQHVRLTLQVFGAAAATGLACWLVLSAWLDIDRFLGAVVAIVAVSATARITERKLRPAPVDQASHRAGP